MKKLLAVAILLPILSFSYEINFNKSFDFRTIKMIFQEIFTKKLY